jgi:hypothetical protein
MPAGISPELSPQLYSTFCCWPSIRHCFRNGRREGASNVESQETCRITNFYQSFRVKGDV